MTLWVGKMFPSTKPLSNWAPPGIGHSKQVISGCPHPHPINWIRLLHSLVSCKMDYVRQIKSDIGKFFAFRGPSTFELGIIAKRNPIIKLSLRGPSWPSRTEEVKWRAILQFLLIVGQYDDDEEQQEQDSGRRSPLRTMIICKAKGNILWRNFFNQFPSVEGSSAGKGQTWRFPSSQVAVSGGSGIAQADIAHS